MDHNLSRYFREQQLQKVTLTHARLHYPTLPPKMSLKHQNAPTLLIASHTQAGDNERVKQKRQTGQGE
ncbi:MAG: hypothetical protein IKF75_06160 [Lachnospiraceae bacterium]|nr:hypothetical protein [Lachnospiraceae bacterium]